MRGETDSLRSDFNASLTISNLIASGEDFLENFGKTLQNVRHQHLPKNAKSKSSHSIKTGQYQPEISGVPTIHEESDGEAHIDWATHHHITHHSSRLHP